MTNYKEFKELLSNPAVRQFVIFSNNRKVHIEKNYKGLENGGDGDLNCHFYNIPFMEIAVTTDMRNYSHLRSYNALFVWTAISVFLEPLEECMLDNCLNATIRDLTIYPTDKPNNQ